MGRDEGHHGDRGSKRMGPAGVAQRGVNDLAPSAGKHTVPDPVAGPGKEKRRTRDSCFLRANEISIAPRRQEVGDILGSRRGQERDSESEFARPGTQGPAGKKENLSWGPMIGHSQNFLGHTKYRAWTPRRWGGHSERSAPRETEKSAPAATGQGKVRTEPEPSLRAEGRRAW